MKYLVPFKTANDCIQHADIPFDFKSEYINYPDYFKHLFNYYKLLKEKHIIQVETFDLFNQLIVLENIRVASATAAAGNPPPAPAPAGNPAAALGNPAALAAAAGGLGALAAAAGGLGAGNPAAALGAVPGGLPTDALGGPTATLGGSLFGGANLAALGAAAGNPAALAAAGGLPGGPDALAAAAGNPAALAAAAGNPAALAAAAGNPAALAALAAATGGPTALAAAGGPPPPVVTPVQPVDDKFTEKSRLIENIKAKIVVINEKNNAIDDALRLFDNSKNNECNDLHTFFQGFSISGPIIPNLSTNSSISKFIQKCVNNMDNTDAYIDISNISDNPPELIFKQFVLLICNSYNDDVSFNNAKFWLMSQLFNRL